MLLPSLNCPGSCSYCFGPRTALPGNEKSGFTVQQLEGLAAWAAESADGPLQITFHGGEPLTAGKAFFRQALPMLAQAGQVYFGVQSNLWLLDEEWLDLFQTYRVGLGTSLDGPEAINDAQRGRGYYRRTMRGLDLARRRGMNPGVIATLTKASAPRWREILDFFDGEHLNVAFHAALAVLGGDASPDWGLGAEDYGETMVAILDSILARDREDSGKGTMQVEPIDSICRGIGSGSGGLCTFDDCLGKYAAVSPEGGIYSCQRFVSMENFRLGQLGRNGPLQPLEESPAWRRLEARREAVEGECAGCEFFGQCRGGCPYNALAAGGENFKRGLRDPYCRAYQRIYKEVVDRAAAEFFSPENLNAIVEHPDDHRGLMREGALLQKIAASSGRIRSEVTE